jgi:hypothetical protein
MLVALLIFALFFSKIKFRDNLIVCPILIVAFILAGLLCGLVVKQITTYDTPSSSYGWNLFVGASETGMWNEEDAIEFGQIESTARTPTEIHEHFASKAFERYREMGLRVIPHGVSKLVMLNSAEYILNLTSQLTEESAHRHTIGRIEYSLAIYMYYVPILLLALAYCLFSFAQLLRKKPDILLVPALYTVGSFAALFFLEVAPRYTV